VLPLPQSSIVVDNYLRNWESLRVKGMTAKRKIHSFVAVDAAQLAELSLFAPKISPAQPLAQSLFCRLWYGVETCG